jgi:ATP-dependent DNA helicase Rep
MAGCVGRQSRSAAARLPRAEGDQARAELPIHDAHTPLGHALIANNPKLHAKKLWSEHGHGDAIRVTPETDDESEAEGVVRRLLAHRFEHRGKFTDYAILYRGNHRQSSSSNSYGHKTRPTKSPGTIVLSALRSGPGRLSAPHHNDDDDPAFIRALTTPKRGIGATTLDRLGTVASVANTSLFGAIFAEQTARRFRSPARRTRCLLHADQ